MTITELLTLPDAELNRIVAMEVFGWDFCNVKTDFSDNPPIRTDYYDGEEFVCSDFYPATDHNDDFRVQKRIAELGLQRQYVIHLCSILDVNYCSILDWGDIWAIRDATAKEICAAAILAVRGAKG